MHIKTISSAIYALALLGFIPLFSSDLRAQNPTSDWCNIDPWPILAGCGSLSVGLQFSGDDVFCNGETVIILNTLPSNADSTLVCWGDGTFTAVPGTPMTFSHVYSFPPDTCVDECITFIIRLAVLKHCPPDKMSFKWVATPVQVCFPPIAQFSIPPGVCVDDPVSISNFSCENAYLYHYQWSFPGATPSSDTTASPGPISYPSPGTYQVSMVLSNEVCGSDTYNQSITVGPPATAVASLPDTICVNEVVMPTNSSQNVAASNPFLWSFPTNPGGGAMFVPPSNAFDATPKMKFTKPGVYVVRLNVAGCHTPVWTHTIVVNGPPIISRTDTLPDSCVDPLNLDPNNYLNVTNVLDNQVVWSFNDNGVTSNFTGLNPPPVSFSGIGMKIICVNANGQCGQPGLCDTFFIKTPAIAQFSIPAILCAPADTLVPINNSINASTYTWSLLQNGTPVPPNAAAFVSNTNNQSANPKIRFTQEGLFTLRLSTGAAPCGMSLEQNIEVHLSPTLALANIPTLCNDTTFNPLPLVTFGGGMPDLYSWSFLNGSPNSANTQDPGQVNFSGLGAHAIALTSQNVCDTVTVVDTFQIVALQQIMLAPAGPFCHSDPAITLSATPPVGSWTGNGITGNSFNPGNINSSAWNVPFNLQYSIGTPGTSCYVSAEIPVTVWGTVVAAGNPETACIEDGIRILSGGQPGGGLWSGPGIVNPVTGAFDPAAVPGVGNYTVTYTFTDANNCANTATKVVTVSGPPQITGALSNLCIGEILPIDSFMLTGNNTCFWDFGDNTSSNICNPVKSYTTAGTYTVSLNATSAAGCDASISFPIVIIPPPDAAMALDVHSGCATLPVTFSNNSSLNAYTSYFWDFGNGLKDTTTFSAPNPPVVNYGQVFNTTTYQVKLSASNRCASVSVTDTVTVFPQPVAQFGAARNVICSSDTVSFNNYSIGEPDTYRWYVNGLLVWTQAQLPPQHFSTGSQDSLYVVTLVVMNECGSDTLRDSVLVRPNPVHAFFNLPVSSICQHNTIQLTDLSTNGLNVSWDFGDGNVGVGDTISHTFNTPGAFPIYLFVNNGCGYDTTFQTLSVWPSPVPLFEPAAYACLGAPILFQNKTSDIAGASWDFGDGSPVSTEISPTHIYSQTGTYLVTLTVFSQTHLCPATATATVLVRSLPVPTLQIPQTSGCQPFTFTGMALSPGNNTYIWDFGDGATATGANVSHVYTDTLNYDLRVSTIDPFNCRADTVISPIRVHPKPIADFSISQANLCQTPANLVFENNSLLADAYLWTFQNGQSSDQENPNLLVSDGGPFSATLIAENQFGCLDSISKTHTILSQPALDYTVSSTEFCTGNEVEFQNNSENVNQFYWSFGDGQFSTEQHPTHLYDQAGVYTVKLWASADSVCFDSLSKPALVRVLFSPTAGFFANPVTDTTVVPNGIYRFTDNSTSDVLHWDWDFGDGLGFSSEQNPVYAFDSTGEKIVVLLVTNSLGCTDTASLPIKPEFFGNLFVPNALTPDYGSDGERLFLPKGANLKEYEISIFAPNGQCVFHSTELDRGHPAVAWDGSYKGQPLPQGVYYWKVRAIFNNNKSWQGMKYQPDGPSLLEGKVWLGR